jgi:hypothetical protein
MECLLIALSRLLKYNVSLSVQADKLSDAAARWLTLPPEFKVQAGPLILLG